MRYKSLSGFYTVIHCKLYITECGINPYQDSILLFTVHFIYITECGINPYQDSIQLFTVNYILYNAV